MNTEETTTEETYSICDRFEISSHRLGKGAFGVVVVGADRQTDDCVAIKFINHENLSPSSLAKTHLEIEALEELNHPYVVRLLGHDTITSLQTPIGTIQAGTVLVLDYAAQGELFTMIKETGYMNEKLARTYFAQLVSALLYCHSKGVYHRDLKPENILLASDFSLKVADFGLSRKIDPSTTNPIFSTDCGTLAYKAPELTTTHRVDYDGGLVDAFGTGMILFLLLLAHPPWSKPLPNDAWFNRFSKRAFRSFWNPHMRAVPGGANLSHEVRDLNTRLLLPHPEERLALSQVSSHPWMMTKREEEEEEEERRGRRKELPCSPSAMDEQKDASQESTSEEQEEEEEREQQQQQHANDLLLKEAFPYADIHSRRELQEIMGQRIARIESRIQQQREVSEAMRLLMEKRRERKKRQQQEEEEEEEQEEESSSPVLTLQESILIDSLSLSDENKKVNSFQSDGFHQDLLFDDDSPQNNNNNNNNKEGGSKSSSSGGGGGGEGSDKKGSVEGRGGRREEEEESVRSRRSSKRPSLRSKSMKQKLSYRSLSLQEEEEEEEGRRRRREESLENASKAMGSVMENPYDELNDLRFELSTSEQKEGDFDEEDLDDGDFVDTQDIGDIDLSNEELIPYQDTLHPSTNSTTYFYSPELPEESYETLQVVLKDLSCVVAVHTEEERQRRRQGEQYYLFVKAHVTEEEEDQEDQEDQEEEDNQQQQSSSPSSLFSTVRFLIECKRENSTNNQQEALTCISLTRISGDIFGFFDLYHMIETRLYDYYQQCLQDDSFNSFTTMHHDQEEQDEEEEVGFMAYPRTLIALAPSISYDSVYRSSDEEEDEEEEGVLRELLLHPDHVPAL